MNVATIGALASNYAMVWSRNPEPIGRFVVPFTEEGRTINRSFRWVLGSLIRRQNGNYHCTFYYSRGRNEVLVYFFHSQNMEDTKVLFQTEPIERNLGGERYHFHSGLFHMMHSTMYRQHGGFMGQMRSLIAQHDSAARPLSFLFYGYSMGGVMAKLSALELVHLPEFQENDYEYFVIAAGSPQYALTASTKSLPARSERNLRIMNIDNTRDDVPCLLLLHSYQRLIGEMSVILRCDGFTGFWNPVVGSGHDALLYPALIVHELQYFSYYTQDRPERHWTRLFEELHAGSSIDQRRERYNTVRDNQRRIEKALRHLSGPM